jgi:uncharacterized protein
MTEPMDESGVIAQKNYAALVARVDAFFARVASAHPGQMQCRRGCFACCHPHLHLLPFEWARVRQAVAALDEAARAAIVARAHDAGARHCALLDPDGACSVWVARPMVCRSHGLPLRLEGRRAACDLNFVGTLDDVPEGDVLDQAQLSVIIGLLDRMAQSAVASDGALDGVARDENGRVPLRAALAVVFGPD